MTWVTRRAGGMSHHGPLISHWWSDQWSAAWRRHGGLLVELDVTDWNWRAARSLRSVASDIDAAMSVLYERTAAAATSHTHSIRSSAIKQRSLKDSRWREIEARRMVTRFGKIADRHKQNGDKWNEWTSPLSRTRNWMLVVGVFAARDLTSIGSYYAASRTTSRPVAVRISICRITNVQ